MRANLPKNRELILPALDFGVWFPFEKRQSVPNCKMPGVYAIAASDSNLEGYPVDWADVSYIGMTVSQNGLSGRWSQFYRAIRGEKGCHSGGYSAYETLGHYEQWSKRLFVAAMPVDCNTNEPSANDLLRMGWVAFFEYEAFSEFRRHSLGIGKPEFNTK